MHLTSQRGRRAVVRALLVTAGLAASTVAIGATPTSAAGLVPTTTTVTTSVNPAVPGQVTRLEATVRAFLVGSLPPLTPTGPVSFTVDGVPAGQAPLVCGGLLSSCVAKLEVALPTAPSSPIVPVVATYEGDLLTASSSGVVAQQINEPAACDRANGCDVTAYSANGTASLRVQVPGDGSGEVDCVLHKDNPKCKNGQGHGNHPDEGGGGGGGATAPLPISFSTDGLECSRPNTGDMAIFDYQVDVPKDVTYSTYGLAAVEASSDPWLVCYHAPMAFRTADGSMATTGHLPRCSDTDWVRPCIDSSTYTAVPSPILVTKLLLPPGDPNGTR